mgnify:CR=1 FL=1
MTDRIPLDLIGIRVELPTNTPILLLKERNGDRYLPIWINTPEATSTLIAKARMPLVSRVETPASSPGSVIFTFISGSSFSMVRCSSPLR